MATRSELEIRAASIGVTAANYPNDSKLEQAVIYAENAKSPSIAEVKATGTLTLSGNAVAGETVTIGGKVYTWVATAVENAVENQVLVGAAATNSLDNLKSAIMADPAGRGSLYSIPTGKHPTVVVSNKTAATVVVTANNSGVKGNSIATTETMTNGSWGAATLASGVNGSGPKARDIQARSGGANV